MASKVDLLPSKAKMKILLITKSGYCNRNWLVSNCLEVLKALSVSAFQIKGVLFFSKLLIIFAVLLKFHMKNL
jgi:hypothetical protein